MTAHRRGCGMLGAALTSAVLVLGLAGCGSRTARIVDCAPGFHNVAGPGSSCVPSGTSTPP